MHHSFQVPGSATMIARLHQHPWRPLVLLLLLTSSSANVLRNNEADITGKDYQYEYDDDGNGVNDTAVEITRIRSSHGERRDRIRQWDCPSTYSRENGECRPECGPGWQAYNGHCYLWYNAKKTYDEAKLLCRSRDGATLPLVKNIVDHNFLNKTFYKDKHKWIGLDDRNSEGKFVWADGTELSDNNAPYPIPWHHHGNGHRQPDDGGPWRTEDCVHMRHDWRNDWNDAPCDSRQWVVCQKPWSRDLRNPNPEYLPQCRRTSASPGWRVAIINCNNWINGNNLANFRRKHGQSAFPNDLWRHMPSSNNMNPTESQMQRYLLACKPMATNCTEENISNDDTMMMM